MRLYLCGPINGRSDEDANGWRQKVKAAWHGECIDPMRRDYRGREMEPGIAAEIVASDLADIDEADALIVYFDRPSVGTAMEVFYAARQGKPVALVNATVTPLSPWLLHHCTYTGRSIADALCHLAGVRAYGDKGGPSPVEVARRLGLSLQAAERMAAGVGENITAGVPPALGVARLDEAKQENTK